MPTDHDTAAAEILAAYAAGERPTPELARRNPPRWLMLRAAERAAADDAATPDGTRCAAPTGAAVPTHLCDEECGDDTHPRDGRVVPADSVT